MASRRLERIAAAIKQCTSETILFKLKDPRRGFVTITKVDVTADLRHAVIYVSIMGEEAEQRTTLRALSSAKGFVQGEIAKRLTTRFTPRVVFKLDETPAKSIEISQLIDRAIAEDESRHPKPATDDDQAAEPADQATEGDEQ